MARAEKVVEVVSVAKIEDDGAKLQASDDLEILYLDELETKSIPEWPGVCAKLPSLDECNAIIPVQNGGT